MSTIKVQTPSSSGCVRECPEDDLRRSIGRRPLLPRRGKIPIS